MGNTSHHPPAPTTEQTAAPQADAPEAHISNADARPSDNLTADTSVPETARTLVAAFPHLSPDPRRIPRAMHDELTQLTARWLAAGHTPADIRMHILRGLPSDGSPVHRPGGLLRHLLRTVPPAPSAPPTPVTRTPGSPPPPLPSAPPVPTHPPGPRLSARLAAMRECEGDGHVQPRLFRPVADETRCPRCTTRTIRRGEPSSSGG